MRISILGGTLLFPVDTDMHDLELARKLLVEKHLTLAIAKDGTAIFESTSNGIGGLLDAVDALGDRMHSSSIADKVAGKAVALLCAYADVEAAYASVLSKKARQVFAESKIHVEYEVLTESILDAHRTRQCPFESAVEHMSDPTRAYMLLKALRQSLGDNAKAEAEEQRERFIPEQDTELGKMRARKLSELMETKALSAKPVIVDDANFNETVKKSVLALIDFWAPWCGPCRALAPTIEEVSKEYAGKVLVGKLNVDENPQTAECFQVFSIPTMIMMKNGQEVDRIVGCVHKRYIDSVLKKHMGEE